MWWKMLWRIDVAGTPAPDNNECKVRQKMPIDQDTHNYPEKKDQKPTP